MTDTNFAARADYAASARSHTDWARYVTRVEAIRAGTPTNADQVAAERAAEIAHQHYSFALGDPQVTRDALAALRAAEITAHANLTNRNGA